MKSPIELKPNTLGAYGISGAPSDVAKTYLLSNISSPNIRNEVTFWFVENQGEAERIASLFSLWNSKNHDYPIYVPNEDQLAVILWSILENKPCLILLPFDQLDLSFVAPDQYREHSFYTKPDLKLTPAELSQQLVSLGYDFNTSADAVGVFSRRGNIVDVFPANTPDPIRFEFGQSQLESISSYRQSSGKKTQKLSEFTIIPNQLSHLESSGRWLEYLRELKSNGGAFIYSDPDEIPNVSHHWENIAQIIKKRPQIVFHPLPHPDANNVFEITSAPLYHKNFGKLIKDLKSWHTKGYSLYSPDYLKQEITDLWSNNSPGSPLPIKFLANGSQLSKPEGFHWPKHKTVFLTELEIFGRREKLPPQKKKRLDLSFIAELKPGDLVVHVDHGIGRFRGLAHNTVDGIEKEYLKLEYAEGDKLSVPVEVAYKIDKYIGSVAPKVHRLSNTTWRRITKKIKAEARKMAEGLVKLYAKRETAKIEPFKSITPMERELAKSFAYEETPDQVKAIREVENDLEGDEPMDRLICGDVGFGKTEVAIRAALKTVANKKQVAILAPTTILAQQHYDTFANRLKKFPVTIDSLSRFKTRSQQSESVAKLKTGETDIIIGTHRLLSPDVKFKKLGLIIIDEEQRFGVQHKEKLKSLRVNAHVLTLTATPIPRTLNFSLSSLRDMTVIRTAPEGRQPIETIIKPHSDTLMKQAIELELSRGGQVYFLYNRVETINTKANQLKKLIPKGKIGIIHGQLPEDQLAKTMSNFDNQKINVLVSTTIIENGLDLPNVNTLIVEDATRFGLAQLYQLRGRIGRGDRQAYAYFLYPQKKLTGEAKKRLQAILEARELGSGFQLALRDLEIRGVGNILGREQHGRVNAIGLSLYSKLLSQAVEEIKTGKAAVQIRDISIDLPLPITIPHDYIGLENQRLKVYRDLSDATDNEELRDRYQAIEKQYGACPTNIKNLYRLLQLRLSAQKTSIESIDTIHVTEGGIVKPRLVIKFLEQYTPDQIKKLLDLNANWVLGENQIKIDFENLSKKWMIEIEKVVKLFQK